MITTLIGYMEDDGTDRNLQVCEEVTKNPQFTAKKLLRPSFGVKLYGVNRSVKMRISPNYVLTADIAEKIGFSEHQDYSQELALQLENGWVIGEHDLYSSCLGTIVTHKMISSYLTSAVRNDAELCSSMGIRKKSELLPVCNKWALFLMFNYKDEVTEMLTGSGFSFKDFVAMEELL